MVVEEKLDVADSIQFTTLPLRPMLTGLITSLVISGRLFCEDILEKVNMVELTVSAGAVLDGLKDEIDL